MSKYFEQKNNSLAFLLIAIAATLWGAFGLISSLAQVKEIPWMLFTLFATFFATIVPAIYLKIKKVDIEESFIECLKIEEFKRLLFFRMMVSFNILVTVAAFHFLSNKIVGVVIMEINPLIAIILAHYFFTDEDYEKDKESNSYFSWVLVLIAISGVIMALVNEINLSELYTQISNQDFSDNAIGIFLSFLGAILVGYTTVLGPKMTAVLKKSDYKKNKKLSSFVISNISRLLVTGLTFILLLVISLFFHDLNEYQSLLNKESILLTFVFGVFVIYIPAILGMVASGSMATTKFNYLGWFIAPIVATFSLWIFEFGEINSTLIISLLLVLIPNILLNLEIGESFSFKVTFIWILFSSILLFYYEGISVEDFMYYVHR
jgi:drug/metabolite transporter (DMT)-like permease